MNLLLFVLDWVLALPLTLLRTLFVYVGGARYDIPQLQVLDTLMHDTQAQFTLADLTAGSRKKPTASFAPPPKQKMPTMTPFFKQSFSDEFASQEGFGQTETFGLEEEDDPFEDILKKTSSARPPLAALAGGTVSSTVDFGFTDSLSNVYSSSSKQEIVSEED